MTEHQYYVYTGRTPAGSAFTYEAILKRSMAYEAILKRAMGGGGTMTLSHGYGYSPEEAINDLHLEHWAIDKKFITFVREGAE